MLEKVASVFRRFNIFFIYRHILYFSIMCVSYHILSSTEFSWRSFGMLFGLIGLLLIDISPTLYQFKFLNNSIRDLKLVEYQDRILAEIRASNTQTAKFIMDQAELLTKMTIMAAKKTSDSTNSPN